MVISLISDTRVILKPEFSHRKKFLLSGECTALHEAIMKIDKRIVKILLEAGADPKKPLEGYFLFTNGAIRAISCQSI